MNRISYIFLYLVGIIKIAAYETALGDVIGPQGEYGIGRRSYQVEITGHEGRFVQQALTVVEPRGEEKYAFVRTVGQQVLLQQVVISLVTHQTIVKEFRITGDNCINLSSR